MRKQFYCQIKRNNHITGAWECVIFAGLGRLDSSLRLCGLVNKAEQPLLAVGSVILSKLLT